MPNYMCVYMYCLWFRIILTFIGNTCNHELDFPGCPCKFMYLHRSVCYQ